MGYESERQRPGQIFGRRVEEWRTRRGLTQEQLAAELRELGYPMVRATVAKIEGRGTRAKNARLEDVLAFALALGVAPVQLIVPDDDEAAVAAAPDRPLLAPVARAWIQGDWPLEDADSNAYLTDETPDSRRARAAELTKDWTPLQRVILPGMIVHKREIYSPEVHTEPREEKDDG